MGIITSISTTWDDDREVQRIFVASKFGINSRSSLNRVAGRAAVGSGVGQRTLVAAAYDEEGIDLVWRDGLFHKDPEEKFPDAKKINYYSVPIDRSSDFGDITGIPLTKIPRGRFGDQIKEGIDSFRPETVLHVWEIPYSVGGGRK